MNRRRPDLIVPVHDRRRHRRIVTLRNVRNAIAVLVLAFAIVSVASELRGRSSDSYGRLYKRTLPATPEVRDPEPLAVVEEAPVADQVGVDPTLMVPAARGQWLLEETEPAPVAAAAAPRLGEGEADVAIVGGPDGVAVVTTERRAKPVLSGGIFRQE